jgi:hypothetical protein
MKGFRDLDTVVTGFGSASGSSTSPPSFFFPPIEKRVIFLRVERSMFPVVLRSPGGDPAPFPSALAREEAVWPL